MGQWLLIVLLPFAAWSGWWLGMRKEARELRQNKSRAAYFEGISYLLNDETERAVEVFISIADVDKQAIDNQLTLGRLFRKRGELDRALHLHQQLMKYEALDELLKQAVQYELALDYEQAGMIAQAQELLVLLVNHQYRLQETLPILLRLYEKTQQWQAAIELAQMWQLSGHGDLSAKVAHYYCELALLMGSSAWEECLALLHQALQYDRDCARANWILGEYYLQNGQYINAIHVLQSIAKQRLALLPDALPMLEQAYRALGRFDEYVQWLSLIEARYQKVRLTLACAKVLPQTQAVDLLQQRLQKQGNPLLFADYLNYRLVEADNAFDLQASFVQMVAPKTIYQCEACGFRQQRLIWHCPSCAAWGSFYAVTELKIAQR